MSRGRNIGAALLVWAVALHLLFFSSAGALWRDEANSAQQARLPSWRDVSDSLQYDSFPMLYPALLRTWSGVGPGGSDAGLRLFGLTIGLALVASIAVAARMLGVSWPAASLVLVAASPLVISEADSVRPYGTGLICLVWTFTACARFAATGRRGSLMLAALWATLSVQTSYSNAAQVAVFVLCCAAAAYSRDRTRALLAFVPGAVAAASLIPYVPPLRRAADWAGMLRSPVDWQAFAGRFVDWRFAAFAAVWIAFGVLACAGLAHAKNTRPEPHDAHRAYCGLVMLFCLPAQIAVIGLLGIAPFPRYFLPALVPLALSFDVAGGRSRARLYAGIAGAMLLGAPAWQTLRQRLSNADELGALLTREAKPSDLVVVSPWFLHPSFQRYYAGVAAWVTVPDIARAPIMRYDLIKRAMLRADTTVYDGIDRVLSQGGDVWFVTQRRFRSSPGSRKPEPPAVDRGKLPGYARFRSYWEDGIEYRLAGCCTGEERVLAGRKPVREEEDLLLIRWKLRDRQR